MKKKPEYPKINYAEFVYSGNTELFEKFISGMISDYFTSTTSEDYLWLDFVGCVEKSETCD